MGGISQLLQITLKQPHQVGLNDSGQSGILSWWVCI